MKALGYLIGACIVLAVVRTIAAAMILAIVLAVVVGAFTKPRETFGLLGFVLIANLFQAYPLGCLVVIGLLVGVGLMRQILPRTEKGDRPF
jgi:quinol-cytochrome oxidoreductase complex cytochrome b subunit